jgi:hypothetical protein
MDDIVKQALAKWPNVPDCRGWLGLDARGQWWMRDDRCQAIGGFASGRQGAKGSLLQHDKLIAFIGRNYEAMPEGHALAGQWYFQNGPQRVFVELEATPWVFRVQADFSLSTHTGIGAAEGLRMQTCVLDEHGRVYADTSFGFGLIHTQDVSLAADAIEQGLWVPHQTPTAELPSQFGYVRSPQKLGGTPAA